MPYTIDRPSPVPRPTAFVVKNGSKMRAWVCASMPMPVSVTANRSVIPGVVGAFDAAALVGPVRLTLDAGWSPRRVLPTDDLHTSVHPMASGMVGVEYAGADVLASGYTCPSDHSNDGAITIVGGPAANAFLTNSIVRHSKAAGVMKGWSADQGPDVDFTPTNTFEDIGECVQTIIVPTNTNCPSTCK